MYRFLLCSFAALFIGCSSEDAGNLLTEYPITYELSEVRSLGVNSYYFTDTIIYRTNNDLTDSIEFARDSIVNSRLYGGDSLLSNFIITQITFMDPQNVTIRGRNGENSTAYSEISGLGRTSLSPDEDLGFKINPDLSQLITCFSQTSSRKVDTIYEGNFLPQLDTLFTEDSLTQFQLEIIESPLVVNSFCENFNELSSVSEFASTTGLVNDDRIITHRTDIVFLRSEQ